MSDASIASKTEDWLVALVKALQFDGGSAFDANDVKPWGGTSAGKVEQLAEELFTGERDTAARVLFVSDAPEELADDQIEARARYLILIGIRNRRPGVARRGDETTTPKKTWGTNIMRDLLKAALNRAKPDLSDDTTYTQETRYLGSKVEFNSQNTCVMYVSLDVLEVPKAPPA